MQVALRPAFKSGGLSMDADGNLVACEHVGSAVVRYGRDGRRDVLAYHHRGEYLNSPNDIVVRGSDGSVYFTDPDYGRWNDWVGVERNRGRFRGVYRIPPDGGGEAQLLVAEDEFDEPNGICFSPDESVLYVNDSPRAHVKAFDVAPDGTLSGGRRPPRGHRHRLRRRHRGRRRRGGGPPGAARRRCRRRDALRRARQRLGDRARRHLGHRSRREAAGRRRGARGRRQPRLGRGRPALLFIMSSTTVHVVRTKVGPAPLPHHRPVGTEA